MEKKANCTHTNIPACSVVYRNLIKPENNLLKSVPGFGVEVIQIHLNQHYFPRF